MSVWTQFSNTHQIKYSQVSLYDASRSMQAINIAKKKKKNKHS